MTRSPASSTRSAPSSVVPRSEAGSVGGAAVTGKALRGRGSRGPGASARRTASGAADGRDPARKRWSPPATRASSAPASSARPHRSAGSEAGVLEAVRMAAEHRDRAGGEDRREAEELDHLVEVVHVVVVAEDGAEVRAARAHEAVVRPRVDERGELERAIRDVE